MFRIEPIQKGHNTKTFDCGEAELNSFLKQFALKNDLKGIGRTYVALRPDETEVVGYYTISTGSVRFSQLPEELKLPRYPIPTVHMGRLAVDLAVQGQGLGEALLFEALGTAERASRLIGIKAIELIALNDKAKRFYLRYGFTELVDDPMHLYLSMDTIREAVGATAVTTYSLNRRAFEAKEARRQEKANYSPERKMAIVEKLRDATRDLRTNSRIVKKGKIPQD